MCYLPRLSLLFVSNGSSRATNIQLLLLGVLLCLFPTVSFGQSVVLVSPVPINFGNVNLCKVGQTTPAPCSKTLTLDYKVTASGMLGTPKVVTQGSPNLDFTLAPSSTCIGLVTAGTTCTVNVDFAPKFPGTRPGGVLITDANGKLLATTLIAGGAVGPQIGFNPGIQKLLLQAGPDESFQAPNGLAVDGGGDVLIGNQSGPLLELPAGGGAPITVPTGPAATPDAVVIDGAGDLFVYDGNYDILAKVPAGGGTPIEYPNNFQLIGEIPMTGMAVNLNGDLYFALSYDYDELISYLFEFPAAEGGKSMITLPYSDYIAGFGIGGGNELFVLYGENPQATKFPPDGSAPVTLPFAPTQNLQIPLVVDGNSDVLLGNQELAPGASATITEPFNTSFRPSPIIDSAGNFYYLSGDLHEVYELQRSQLPTLDFGSVSVGGTKTLPLQFANTGNETLTVTPSLESQSYKILSATPENCLAGVAAAHTCTLQIQFAPQQLGPHSIELTLKGNGAADTVTLLKGTGTT